MNTRLLIVILLAGMLLFLCPMAAQADGVLVYPPLESGEFIEPFQQCFLIDAGDGSEAMVLQVFFQKTDLKEFGWLIPLPSAPEVRKESDAVFYSLGDLTWPRYVTSYGGGCGGSSSGIEPPMPLAEDSQSGINMIEKQVVGNYEVFTVEADDPEDLKNWIENNGYEVPDGYQSVFQNYINKGWVFVAIKIYLPDEVPWYSYEGDYVNGYQSEPFYYGVLHPLFLQFDTDQLVYPMLISMLNGGSTDLTMYVLADHRMQFKDSEQKWAGWVNEDEFPDHSPMEFYVRGKRFLTRLRRVYFWETDYDADLYLTQAPDDKEQKDAVGRDTFNFLMMGYLAVGFPVIGRLTRRRKKTA